MPTLAELIAERERRRAAAAAAAGGTAPEAPPPGGVSMDALIAERDRRRAAQAAPVQPDVNPWGDGQAFDDMYARKPQKDPMLSPLRPDARTLTSGQPSQLKVPTQRGPVMSPAQIRATQAPRDAAVAQRTEQANRWKTDSPFGTPVDEMGMPIAVTDAQRDGGMYGVRDDVGKGIVASPIHAERAVVGATESILNLPADVYNEVQKANARHVLTPQEEMRNVNRMPQLMGKVGVQKAPPVQVPRFDFSAAKIPVPQELESATGYLGEGLAQFLISRKLVGTAAPGGGLAANLGKDAGAVFVGIDGSSGRLADIVPADAIPEGPLRDYFNYLKTQPDDSPLIGRFKNFLEDMTVSGPMIAPQAVIAPTARAVGNAINPTLTPTNAGGVAARAGVPQMPSVAPAVAATQNAQQAPTPPYPRPDPTQPAAQAGAQQPPVSPMATQTAQQAPTQPQTATAPPVPPTPPNAPAVTAAAPQPGPGAGVVPPAGQLTPVPTNEAVAAFNALPPKTREAMLRALQSSGMDRNNSFGSMLKRIMTGEFRASPQAMDAIRAIQNAPEDKQIMFALELMKNNGGDLETILPAMGRKWATEGAQKDQMVGGIDRGREIMDQNVRSQINAQGDYITEIAERNFGPGNVPAAEALDAELDTLSAAYETILSTKRSPTGRLRSPAKKAAVYDARKDLAYYLQLDEVSKSLPEWVKKKIMRQASEDLRRLKFTNDELSLILKGDGAVLAPLFDGYSPLVWSDEMWRHLAAQYPTQAAHSLQSSFRSAADDAWRRGTPADIEDAKMLQRMRGESGKGGLLDMLEKAVPGYRETRMKYGDVMDAVEAQSLLERFKTAANNEGDVGEIIKGLKALPARQREVAENQITSLIRQELGRKIDSAKLSELADPNRPTTPNLSALSNQNFLNALEDVFGARGKELADGIRLARASTDTLTSLHPKYNSRTQVNEQDVKNAGSRYEDPAGMEGGALDNSVKALAGGAGVSAFVAPQYTMTIAGLAAGKAIYNLWQKGKRLSNSERNQLVDYLFRVRKEGDISAQAPRPRPISPGGVAARAASNALIGAGVGGLSSNGDPNAIAAGAIGGAAFGAGRKIVRDRSTIIKPPPGNRLRTGRNPPPAGPAVGGPNGPRPLPGQTSPASPTATGIVVGGIGGAMADQENPLRGAAIGAGVLGAAGAGVGNRLSKGSRPKPPKGPPAPVSSTPKPPPDQAGFGGKSLPMDEAERVPLDVSEGFRIVEVGPAKVTYTVSDGYLKIDMLKVPAEARGQGAASKAVDFVLSEADKNGLTVHLTPDPVGTGGMSKSQLQDFYKSRGFVPNTGGTKDFSVMSSMIREPRPSETQSSKLLAGVSGQPEAIGAGLGTVFAPDADGDGEVSFGERAGAAITGGVMGRGARAIGNRLGGAGGVKPPPAGKFRGPNNQTFAGVNAKTADKAALARAQNMEAEGASRDDIWDETGWFKGVDGKWRFEIDDSGAKLANFYDPAVNPKIVRAHVPQKPGEYTPQALDFEEYMSHPELERAYFPTREQAPSVMFDNLGSARGSYSEANDMLTMDSASFLAKDEGRSTALHELQHGVQAREGFAKGSSPEAQAQALAARRKRDVNGIYTEMQTLLRVADRNTYDAWNELVMARVNRDFDRAGEIENVLQASDDGRRLLDLDWKARSTSAGTVDETEAYEAYRRQAGEAEARNVQTRDAMRMRGEKPGRPWETQDVPDDQQIVRFGGGKAESRPKGPPTGNRSVAMKYPTAPKGEWYGDANYQTTGGRMTEMTPDEFLARARPMEIDDVARENIDDLKAHIKSGKTLDPLALHKSGKEDGRHRAIAARELGIEKVPVLVWGDAATPTTSVPVTRRPPAQAGFGRSPTGNRLGKPKPPPKGPLRKPKPVEARRAAPRGNNPFSDPRLTPGENKTAEMVLNGYSYDEIADEMMTSRDVVKTQASAAQRKLGTDVKLPLPGMGKRPQGSTRKEAAFELFDSGVGNAQIAERLGISVGNVRTYRSYWKQRQSAPVASADGAMYNPPAMPERPFEADYPQSKWPDGPPVDAEGRLTRDMDRRPLDQNSAIIGRNKAPGYGPKSEADRSLRDRIAVIQTLKKAGSSLERVPRSPDKANGSWAPTFDANGRLTGRSSVQIADDLDRPIVGLDDQEVTTLSHELAHSIDFKGGPAALRARNVDDFNDRKWGIDHKNPHRSPEARAELESQLERIYTDLNNPVDGEVRIRTPKDHGYEAINADRELWAEAIRAYMYDPNYIKTVAPDVAFAIRDHVNGNKSLRKTIQFNAAPTIVGLGGLGLGAAALSAQPAEAQKR